MRAKKYLVETLGTVAMFAAVLQGTICRGQPSTPGYETNCDALFVEMSSLDPHSEKNLNRLAQIADRLASLLPKESKTEKKQARRSDDLKDLSTAELQKRFTDNVSKYDPRSAAAIGKLVFEISQTHDAKARGERMSDILEVQASIREEHKPPVPEKLGVVSSWVYFFQNVSSGIARGNTIAGNLAEAVNSGSDGGNVDPLPSTFWKRPATISHEDLYAGFGRDRLPRFDDAIYTYNAPKLSSGTHAGFDVVLNGRRYKIKFGEVNSEPFTARLFYALGYNVDSTDYSPEIKVRYDRQMLREFHLRKPIAMHIAPFGIRLWTVQLQTHYDPFTFITKAVLKDGLDVSGAALKQMLFKDPAMAHPEDLPENFRPEVESALDYFVMAPANVQPRDGPTQSIGSWEFGGLGHENRRELRGAGLLAAWLAYFDSRADNTKLRIERDTDQIQLEHYISDLGGGMGEGTGWFSPHGENPNDFTWTFTEPEIVRGSHQMTTPFRVNHFKPVVPTPAFSEMTEDDARWMARLIGQLTEDQLRAALIASGYDNAEARLYLEKLISRRDRMICDLNLENEIALLRPNGQNHELSYTPVINGPFETTHNGLTISARDSSADIVNGKLRGESTSGAAELHNSVKLLSRDR